MVYNRNGECSMKLKSRTSRKRAHKDDRDNEHISERIEENLQRIKDIFSYPLNGDFAVRNLYIKPLDRNGALVYLKGMADINRIEDYIITPLLESSDDINHDSAITEITSKVLHTADVERVEDFSAITEGIIEGNTILFIDGYEEAVSIVTTSYEYRSVGDTKVENVIKGPKESFAESVEVNRSLIRKHIKSEKLITENIVIGERSPYVVSMMYIKDLCDPELVNNVRKRISEIQTEGIIDASEVEQHIEERPYSLVPTVLLTERPDRAAAFLYEGHIVLLSTSPECLIVPVTFWSFFQTSEDHYQRWAYANFIRVVRLLAYLTALLAPGIYIGLSYYHAELLPTDLLLSITAARELVPFPVIFEVLIMEIAFELIREAGSRIPTALGSTISIVGALILGQAAVQAGIISPILIIVVSLTGLSSFAIPETSSNYMVRITRFIFLFSGATMGFLGIAAFLTICIAYLTTVKSFEVPFLSPVAPNYKSSKDTIFRSPIWRQYIRPFYMKSQDSIRKKKPEGRQNQ